MASSSRQGVTQTLHSLPTASQPSSTILISGIPVTQVNDSNKPKITTQMNTYWMRGFEDQSKQPQVIVSAGQRRGQLDAEIIQKFRIIFFEEVYIPFFSSYSFIINVVYQNDVDPTIFPVQVCPEWPKWKISDSPDVVQRLGNGRIDFYDQDFKIWVECPFSYPHTMRTDCYLLLRRQGVRCQDLAKHLLTAARVPSTSRVYMSSVRKSLHVRTKSLKRRGKDQTAGSEEESEGEVEFVEDTCTWLHFLLITRLYSISLDRPKHKRVKSESAEPTRPTLPRLKIPHTPSGLSSNSPISILDTPPPASGSATSTDSTSSFFLPSPLPPVSPVLSSIASPSPTPRLSPTIVGPPPLIDNGEPWPYNMYVFDVDAGLKKMKALMLARGGNYAQRFTAAFNQPAPVTSTYYDQVNKWKNAPESIRNACLAAMRTREGEWSHFIGLVNASLKK